MLKRLARFTFLASALGVSLSSGSAFAASCTGVNVGTSQTSDVSFAGLASDACVIAGSERESGQRRVDGEGVVDLARHVQPEQWRRFVAEFLLRHAPASSAPAAGIRP